VATPLATAFVRIRPDVNPAQFRAEADRGIKNANLAASGKTAGTHFTSGFRTAAIGIGGVLTAAFAAVGAVRLFTGFIADAREAARVGRITAATIQATGGAANITAKQVDALARAMMYKTGADDETIQAGMNMLLTFRNVRNEVGKGNDIFNRASADLLDMTAALNGGDLSSESLRKTAIRLGKALNDPIAGMTALRRVGVTFTKTQVEMVKGWVEHGQVLRAQKYILKEVEREFGGTAAAAADPIQRLKVMFKEVGESIGKWMLGPLTRFVDYITGTAIPQVKSLWEKVSSIWKQPLPATRGGTAERGQGGPYPSTPPSGGIAERQQGGPMAEPPPLTGWQKFGILLRDVWGNILRPLGAWWSGTLLPALKQIWAAVGPSFTQLGGAVKSLWGSFRILWAAVGPFVGPVLKIAVGILVIAFKAFAWWLSNVLAPLFRMLAIVFSHVINGMVKICGDLLGAWRRMTNFLASAWSTLVHGLRVAFATVVGVILGLFGSLLHGAVVAFGWIPGIGGKLKTAEKQFRTFAGNVTNAIAGIQGKTVSVNVRMTAANNPYGGINPKNAQGGLITEGTGPTSDDVLSWVSKGEVIVPAHMVKAGAVDHLRGKLPRFATGGQVGQGVSVKPGLPSQSVINAQVNAAVIALAKKFAASMATAFGGSTAIVRDAMSWIGKIPYVWGGTAVPGGADCSGFVQAIYRRHGISAPRTSEAQGAWVRRTGPIPGGLAFYNSPAGGPPPGHVAIVGDRGMVISQGGGMGPQYVPLRSMALMFTGVPPAVRNMAGTSGSKTRQFDLGGWIPPGVSVAVNRTGQPERVLSPQQNAGLEARLDRMIAAIEKLPGATGQQVAGALNGTAGQAARRSRYTPVWG
jgi:cell wall-associated NlpC family hydrolase